MAKTAHNYLMTTNLTNASIKFYPFQLFNWTLKPRNH